MKYLNLGLIVCLLVMFAVLSGPGASTTVADGGRITLSEVIAANSANRALRRADRLVDRAERLSANHDVAEIRFRSNLDLHRSFHSDLATLRALQAAEARARIYDRDLERALLLRDLSRDVSPYSSRSFLEIRSSSRGCY